MTKTIHVFTTQDNKLNTITVNASNWGELSDALSNGRYSSDTVVNYDLSNVACKVKETRMSFDNSSGGRTATLPEGLGTDVDFTLFIVPQKIKSGNNFVTNSHLQSQIKDLEQKIEELSVAFYEFIGNISNSVEIVEEVDNSRQDLINQLAQEASDLF